jgi:hypothetical protein
VISPASDDRARATFGEVGRSRRFARVAGRRAFVRLIVMTPLETLTKFMSCFQSSKARPRLDPRNVYGSNPTALQHFELLMALRNKHIVHDENSHYEAAAFAWLEPSEMFDRWGQCFLSLASILNLSP